MIIIRYCKILYENRSNLTNVILYVFQSFHFFITRERENGTAMEPTIAEITLFHGYLYLRQRRRVNN